VRALLAGDLIPNAVELLDATAAEALGLGPEIALVVGFDGLREQVDWQAAEFAALLGPLGGRDVTTLPPATWPRLATIGRDAAASPAALMTFSVLPTLVVDTMEHGAQAARQRGLRSAWAAHAGVGAVTGALLAGGEASAVATVLTEWRAIVTAGGGHATLTWAPLAVKSQVPVWGEAGAAGRIMQRIKTQLDPHNVLNPGRYVAGI
jgi:glycolate oxidase FAD binding subunit